MNKSYIAIKIFINIIYMNYLLYIYYNIFKYYYENIIIKNKIKNIFYEQL